MVIHSLEAKLFLKICMDANIITVNVEAKTHDAAVGIAVEIIEKENQCNRKTMQEENRKKLGSIPYPFWKKKC